jgi:D-amino-acid dehydrogenase
MKSEHIVIVGAGIVGAASAIWLRRAGKEVTLIDKGEPGMGASYGNGCILASSSVVPVTGPGLLRKAPAYLADPNFPLFIALELPPKTCALACALYEPCECWRYAVGSAKV